MTFGTLGGRSLRDNNGQPIAGGVTIQGQTMKRCSGCKQWKDDGEFYKNKSNTDGLSYKCADCMRQATQKYMQTERGKKIRQEYNSSEKAKQSKRRYKQGRRGKELHKKNIVKHSGHIKARRAINNAVRDGKFPNINTQQCVKCNEAANHYHHYRGYQQKHWFDVIPLCEKCHFEVDKEMNQ